MRTSDKLKEAFEQFRPHIVGHKTAMDLFCEALEEVEKMEQKQSCKCEKKERCFGPYFICDECRKIHTS